MVKTVTNLVKLGYFVKHLQQLLNRIILQYVEHSKYEILNVLYKTRNSVTKCDLAITYGSPW